MSYKTILFDLDGTITDPVEGITGGVAHALDAYGVKYESRDALKIFIGPPLREQFMEYCRADEKTGELYVRKYREYYADTGIFENKVYDGIPEMLARLKKAGKTVVLATSKPEHFANIILRHFGLTKYFDFVAGANMDNTRTKKSDVIRYIQQKLPESLDKTSTVMVGDRLHDIDGGKECGLFTIGVTYGYGSRFELTQHDADVIVDSVSELSDVLLAE